MSWEVTLLKIKRFKSILSGLFINVLVAVTVFSSSVQVGATESNDKVRDMKTAGVFAGVGSSIGSNVTGSVVSCMSKGGIFAAIEDYGHDAVDAEEKIAEYLSAYDNVAIARVNDYVNVREKRGEGHKIVGKLYDESMGKILESKKGWYKIKSGKVVGWVKSEYVVTGSKARKLAAKVGTRVANVKAVTLRVRKKANQNSPVLTMVPEGEKLIILKESKEWVKVQIDEDIKGWISKEFVTIGTEFKKAETVVEERQRVEREQAERVVVVNNQVIVPANNQRRNNNNNRKNNNRNNNNYSVKSSGYGKGVDVAKYALNFVGNPYVYGGTSLTSGTDCSGFVMGVYKKFGVSLPRTSGSQRGVGKLVSSGWNPSKAKAGDIICYSGHVAIYLGGGKIVHASNRRTGIKISNRVDYRRVVSVRRVF